MKSLGIALGILSFALSFASSAFCQEKPDRVTLCQLKRDPAAYNHKLVEVSGIVSHGFEDFTLSDPTCASWPAVWLEYGGKSKSGTMYCCGVSADRHRSKELVVEGLQIPLTKDDQFSKFDKLIQAPFRSGRHNATVRATLLGRFFAGRQINSRGDASWGGYGHIGCCSLLAIQQVESVTQDNPK
jgi:hypothetical protein